MKKILSSPIVGEIPQLRNMLEGVGIACILRNEVSAGLSPEVPLPESTPELWIQDDDRLAEALQIKADFQSSTTVVGEDWQCQKCGEISEAQFTSCWKCGGLRAEHNPIKLTPRAETAPAPDTKEIVEEIEGGAPCVACGKRIADRTKYCPFCGWTQPREFYDTAA
jgi:RNA polymerase subunit RPABC4/transcription elongation factor Spt4